MHLDLDLSPFRCDGSRRFSAAQAPTRIPDLYEDKKAYKELMEEYREEIDALQSMMYAHNRYGMLLIFQAMDAAGKDGAIGAVMSGINPHGVKVTSFKRPSETELEHDYLWRIYPHLPERGSIAIFNRSYYEEVLVVRVHPQILTESQRIPPAFTADPEQVWQQRYADIAQLESYLHRNGFVILKFYLHLSKEEQRQRFLDRIEEPDKNWKFAEGDVKERAFWPQYMQAYEDCINATAAPHAPWYAVPADDKQNARLIIAQAVLAALQELDMHYPEVDDARRGTLAQIRQQLLDEA
jgi:PPK2 family polyphosphate:nucleotide phosphotransferase